MIPDSQIITPAIAARYRRLAGPFQAPAEVPLLTAMLHYLVATGARVLPVLEPVGLCIWRLRSECETTAQTERRLAQLSKR